MYAGHFGFSARPFVHGPGEAFFVPNPGVAQAVSRLAAALTARDQVAVVTGGPGVGKSALVERAIAATGALTTGSLTVLRADLRATDPDELFRSVAAAAGLSSDAALPQAVQAAITHERAPERRIVLVVDVLGVNAELARRLLRLVHLAGSAGAQLNLVLQGPHTLHQLLDAPALIHLRQRVGFRYRVRPLALLETAAYIRDLLGTAGADVDARMTANVPAMVFLYVAGVPRLVNTLVDAAFAEAAARHLPRVDGELVKQVAEQLGWKPLNAPAAAAMAGVKPAGVVPPPRAKAPPASAPVAATPGRERASVPIPDLAASDMTSRLLAPAAAEARRPPPERAAAPASLATPDRPVPRLAELGTASSPVNPPMAIPAMDPVDPGATGMLRLEDLDERFAESLFCEDSGHFKALTEADRPAP